MKNGENGQSHLRKMGDDINGSSLPSLMPTSGSLLCGAGVGIETGWREKGWRVFSEEAPRLWFIFET